MTDTSTLPPGASAPIPQVPQTRDEIAADLDRALAEGNLRIENGWLCEAVDEHTCGAGDQYGHEPGCGLIPMFDIAGAIHFEIVKAHAAITLQAEADDLAERANAAAADWRRERES